MLCDSTNNSSNRGYGVLEKDYNKMKVLHVFTLSRTPIAFFDGQFRYLKGYGYEIVLACKREDGIEEFAERNGVKFIPVDIPRSMSPAAILKAIRAIRLIIKDEKPEAVFGHTPIGALVAMIAARLAGVKNRIYYRHGIIYSTMAGVKQKVFMIEEKFVSALATKIVNVSPSLAEKCAEDGINKRAKQMVIGKGTCGGIDAQGIFNPALLDADRLEQERERLGLKGADIVFGFCGRFCKDKGTPELVEAFELFKSRYPELNVCLLMVGPFDERDILPIKTKKTMQESEDIVLTGHVLKKDIPMYYRLMDCFIFPSHREGFGMCVIEASAMEVPILVAPSHGCVDSIKEGVSGYYIELNAESISKGMERMLDKEHMVQIGKQGRLFVFDNFDCRVMWPMISELYRSILE